MKIGFLFPGQGSQSIGMGKDLYEEYEEIREIYKKIQEITGIDVAKLTFEGTEEDLNQTKNAQIAILTMSLGILKILEKYGIKADVAAGLSLGEYSALIYSGILSFEDGVRLVKKRGELMQNLVPEGEWKMAAILGMNEVQVDEVCSKVKKGFAVPANYNCPRQIVVSGDKEGIEEVEIIAKEFGAKRVLPLKTSGPFHTCKLIDASNALREELKKVEIHKSKIEVIKNIDGTPYKDKDNVREILAKHIINPVRFSDSLEEMLKMGVDTFIEVGPGKTLSGFLKKMKTNKEVTILNLEDIKAQTCLITGATRGIGRQIALKFAKAGYNVAINYRTENNDLANTKKELEALGAKYIAVQGDVSNFEDCERFVKEVIEKFGKIDVLVNNAGITKDTLLARMKKEDFEQVIDANLIGTFNVTKNVINYMMKARYGRIINISSVVGVVGNAGQTNYSASKAGIIGFTKSLAKEVASRNILVNAVAPGFIETNMTDVLKDEIKEEIAKNIPLKRMGTAEDVANAVEFLASPNSSYITGQVLNVDGGMVM